MRTGLGDGCGGFVTNQCVELVNLAATDGGFNYVFLRRLQEPLAMGGNSLCAVAVAIAVAMAGGGVMLDVRDDGLRRLRIEAKSQSHWTRRRRL